MKEENQVDVLLMQHRLYLDSHYEDLANLFCNTTGQATTITVENHVLSSWYEGYLYALLLGIKTDRRERNRKGKRLDKAPIWSGNYLNQYKYAIAQLLAKESIINELKLLTREEIKKDFDSYKGLLDQIKKICDEYSNGGLQYLSELYDKDDTIFSDYKSLKNILSQAKPNE